MNTQTMKSIRTALERSMPVGILMGALSILGSVASAQTWQTVDAFQYIAGHSAWNSGLVVAPSGTVFASGYANTSTNMHFLVFGSQDGGTNWFGPLDDFVDPAAAALGGGNMTSDPAGTLYTAVETGSAPAHWQVRQGTSGGTHWTTVDDYAFTGSMQRSVTEPNGVSSDAMGNVYVAGTVLYTNGGGQAWTVRKGVGGTDFSTVDSYSPQGYGAAQAVFAHPTAGVFAVGQADIIQTVVNNKKQHQYISTAWIVRRSTDAGTNWANVDTFQLSPGSYAIANGIGTDANGNLYVVGRAIAPNGYNNWVVRKSADGGSSWSTVDTFQPSSTNQAGARGFAADAYGNLFVAGFSLTTYGTVQDWIVRESAGTDTAWTTVEDFPAAAVFGPHAIAADAFGNVFVGGQANGYWLVRKH
jgi:hypothetical protein